MRFTKILAAGVLSVGMSACQPEAEPPAESEPAAEPTMSEEDLLAARVDAYADAWNRGDTSALADMFVEEGDLIDASGERFHGREAIEGRFSDLFSGAFQGSTLTLNQSSVTFPEPDVAVASGTYTVSGTDATVEGAYTSISVKENGEWKIHCSRPMIPVEQAGT